MACFRHFRRLGGASGFQGIYLRRVLINNQLQVFLVIDYHRIGLSFRQASRVLLNRKERSLTDQNRLFLFLNDLQVRAYFLGGPPTEGDLGFLVILDVRGFLLHVHTHMSTSYLYIRSLLHFNRHGTINVHIISVPVYK